MKKTLVYLPVLLILMAAQSFGQVSQTAVPFLLIAPGARAGGMGETFVAIADDATATHWNPAGLGRYPLSPSWIEMPAPVGEKIQTIALVENNMPEVNYKKYDVWAIIGGQLALWNDGRWQTGTEYNLEEQRSLKSMLMRYTGFDEQQIQPYMERLLDANNEIHKSAIDSLEVKIQYLIPEGYQYTDEITNGFDNLRAAWADLKINSSGFRNLQKIINTGMANGRLSNSALDSVAFGFDNAIGKRAIQKITIPYSIILTSNVNCLESHGGMLYVGTNDGFYRYDPKRNRWKAYSIEDGLPSLTITALAKYKRRSVVVGTDKGPVYFDGAYVKNFDDQEDAPSGMITGAAAVGTSNIWVSTENDLYFFNGSKWSNYAEQTVAVGKDLDKIIANFYGSAGTAGNSKLVNQIKEYNGLTGEPEVGTKIKLPYMYAFKGNITCLAPMGDNVWIGTQRGIMLSTGRSFTAFGYREYTANKDISVRDIASEFVPDQESDKIDLLAQMIKQYNSLDGDMVNNGQTVMVYANALGAPIHSIAAQSSKRAYIGTAYGVVEYSGGMWSRFPKVELAANPAHTIKAESGELWFSTDRKVFIQAKAMKQLTFMHSNYLVQLANDLYYEFFSMVYPTSEWGTFGVGFTFLSFGSQQRTGELGEDLGQFNSYDMAITMSYGTKLMDNLSAGISARYINSHLADVGAGQEKGKGVGFSFAVDGGLLYDVNQRLTLATTVTNIGPEIAYIDADQADPLPSKLALAMAYKIIKTPFNKLTFVGEASKLLVDLNDNLSTEIKEIIPHVGLEYWYSNYVALRTGYIYDDIGSQKYFTLGASLQWTNYRFDLSYVPSSNEKYNRMGNTMRFSMNVGF